MSTRKQAIIGASIGAVLGAVLAFVVPLPVLGWVLTAMLFTFLVLDRWARRRELTVKDVRRIKIETDEALLLQLPAGRISVAQIEEMRHQLAEAIGTQRVLVIDGSAEIQVIKP